MKNITNSKFFSLLLFFLTVLVIAKIVWIVISILFLPKNGIEYSQQSKVKAFYYPVRLSNSKKIKPVVATVVKKSPVVIKKVVGSMKGYKLLALIYDTSSDSDLLVVTVAKGKKTEVLKKGELFNGFKLVSAGKGYASFTKSGKSFKLFLKTVKTVKAKSKMPKKIVQAPTDIVKKKGIIATDDGSTKVISKGLLSSYTKDVDKVWKDIGLGDYKVNGVLKGFKVNFIKRNSDFEKLGLKRGDILTGINGQELDSYNAAFSFYKEMDSIENLTLSIKRNNQDMELEYEIQ